MRARKWYTQSDSFLVIGTRESTTRSDVPFTQAKANLEVSILSSDIGFIIGVGWFERGLLENGLHSISILWKLSSRLQMQFAIMSTMSLY